MGKWNSAMEAPAARIRASARIRARGRMLVFCLAEQWGHSLAFLGICSLQAEQTFILGAFSFFGVFSFLGAFSCSGACSSLGFLLMVTPLS